MVFLDFRGFIVNVGDMMERWTNCLFKSIYHRVTKPEQERYSVAMFFDPSPDCVVECLKSCCSESPPPRFPPVRVADYLKEHYIWLPVNMCNKNITEEEMRTG